MPEASQEVVRKLRLPSVSRDPQEAPLRLIEEGSSKKTSTMIVNSEDALQVLIKSMYDAGKFAFDTETTYEDPWHASLVGISCSMAAGEAYYIPVGHIQTIDNQDPGTQLPLAYVLKSYVLSSKTRG
jgi:DNA polymerase-1